MYLSPEILNPDPWMSFTSFESLYAATISLSSAGVTWKFDDVAHTLVPSVLNMAALSTEPVPTRLCEC